MLSRPGMQYKSPGGRPIGYIHLEQNYIFVIF